tara:strand:+ start:3853 stop:4467 length:615 start_codon:yes stop_codon:yes gene_type:complete
MAIKRSVGRFLTAANNKADQLTAGAKAALCIPAILSGLPDTGKKVIGGIKSKIGQTLENFASTVTGIVTNTITGAVSQITGSITGVIDTVTGVLGQIGSAVKQVEEFKQGIKDRVTDVKEFTAQKENCDFAAASLLNCIAAQAVGSVSSKGAVDLAKGIKPVADFANEVSDKISSPGGAISRTVDKAASQVDRATRLIEKSNII